MIQFWFHVTLSLYNLKKLKLYQIYCATLWGCLIVLNNYASFGAGIIITKPIEKSKVSCWVCIHKVLYWTNIFTLEGLHCIWSVSLSSFLFIYYFFVFPGWFIRHKGTTFSGIFAWWCISIWSSLVYGDAKAMFSSCPNRVSGFWRGNH